MKQNYASNKSMKFCCFAVLKKTLLAYIFLIPMYISISSVMEFFQGWAKISYTFGRKSTSSKEIIAFCEYTNVLIKIGHDFRKLIVSKRCPLKI